MAGHQTRVKKLCCVIPRQACHLVKLAVRQSARDKLLSLHLTDLLSLETLALQSNLKVIPQQRGQELKSILKQYLPAVFF